MREHNEAVNRSTVIEGRDEIAADYAPGTVEDVTQHDGSVLRLRKLAAGLRPDRQARRDDAYRRSAQAAGEIVTGLLYVDDSAGDLHDRLNTVETPLNRLGEAELCPGAGPLAAINAGLR